MTIKGEKSLMNDLIGYQTFKNEDEVVAKKWNKQNLYGSLATYIVSFIVFRFWDGGRDGVLSLFKKG